MKRNKPIIVRTAVLTLFICIAAVLVSCGNSVSNSVGSYTCTISVSAVTLCEKAGVSADILGLIPEGGYLLEPTAASFDEGESVFDVLSRELTSAGIHFEFSETPAFGSKYIEGIGNIYEFDGGELSGWMYSVNGKFPSVGASSYTLCDGDVVKWEYTCDLGRDIGGEFESASEK